MAGMMVLMSIVLIFPAAYSIAFVLFGKSHGSDGGYLLFGLLEILVFYFVFNNSFVISVKGAEVVE